MAGELFEKLPSCLHPDFARSLFSDATVTKIFELSKGRLEEYSGNYSQSVEEREKRLLAYKKSATSSSKS